MTTVDNNVETNKTGSINNDLREVVYKPLSLSTDEKCNPLLPSEEYEKSKSSFLYFSAMGANLIIFVAGTCFSWSSPVIPILQGKFGNETNPLPQPVSAVEESLIAGLISFGACVGPFLSGLSADVLGRKKTLLFLGLPFLLGYIALAFGHSVYVFYLGRFLVGVGIGGVFSTLPMYLGEISEDHNRGTIGCSLGVFIVLGTEFPFLVGSFLTVKLLSLFCIVPLLLYFIVFTLFIPESPYFLASINNTVEAEKALMRLRCQSKSGVQRELKLILSNLRQSNESGGIKALFKTTSLRRAFRVTAGLVVLQQCIGINVVMAFLQSIFESANCGISPILSTNLIGVAQILATLLTIIVVDKWGRKILFYLSTLGTGIALAGLGGYFYLKSHNFNMEMYSLVPVVCLIVYIVAFNLGLGPLPWTVLGEIFPGNVKSIAATLTVLTNYTASFGLTLLFPHMLKYLGLALSFWVFACCALLGMLFIRFWVPETKGKSVQEILDVLSNK